MERIENAITGNKGDLERDEEDTMETPKRKNENNLLWELRLTAIQGNWG